MNRTVKFNSTGTIPSVWKQKQRLKGKGPKKQAKNKNRRITRQRTNQMFLRMLQSKRKENGVGHAMQSSNLPSGNWETVDAVSISYFYGKAVLREIRAFWLVLSLSKFSHTDHFHGNVISFLFFVSKAGKFKTSIAQVPCNKLLTNLTCSSHTGEYWPSVGFCTDCTTTTSGQYSPVRPSCSVSKRLFSFVELLFLYGADYLSDFPWDIFTGSYWYIM